MNVVWILLLVSVYYGITFKLQRRFIYPIAGMSDTAVIETGAQDNGGEYRLWLETDSGRIEAIFLPPLSTDATGRAAPALLFAHGNGELIDEWHGAFEQPRQWGMAVMLVEYPGYGRSEGRPSQQRVTEVMSAAYDWLSKRPEIDAARIIGHGRSLGGGAICALSQERPLAALVLESTFTSIRAFTRKYAMFGPLTRDPYDNLRALQQFKGPVLIYHGRHDRLVPFAHAQKLKAAAAHAQLVASDCGHNDCARPWPALRHFLHEQELL